ncbi:MAG: LytR/AlgR family response regulator transcription factor [Salibacteraceae bacterium]
MSDSNISILVVEDNELHLEKVLFFLESLNYTVCATTDSGDEVESLIHEHKPSLVLLDVQIEGSRSGIEVGREVRSHSKAPVIYLTSYTNDSVLKRAFETNPDAVLHKPIDKPSLQSAIELALFKAKSNPGDSKKARLENEDLFVKVGNSLKKVKLSEIVYIDVSYKNYCDIHTKEKAYAFKSSLNECESKLNKEQFIRVHRTVLVNRNFIDEIDEKNMTITTVAGTIKMGSSYKMNLLKQISKI